MPFKPLVTAGIESLLNTFLYRSPALKTARSRLLGKVQIGRASCRERVCQDV